LFLAWSDGAVDSAPNPESFVAFLGCWLQSTSTGQPLHHLTAIARWAASSAVHSSRVMGSVQRGRSPPAARDRSARLSPSVAVMGWPALGVRRHDRVRGVNTFRPRMRFNVATPKAGGNHPGAVCADRTGKWGHRIQVAGPRLVLAELPACDGPMLTCKPVEPPSRSRDCRQPRRPRWITEDPGHGGPSSSTPTRRCCGEIGSGRLAERLLIGAGFTDHSLVFCRPGGRPLPPERSHVRSQSRCRASRIRLHDLRHTWATLALFAGEHPKVVQERLGHSSASITLDVYSHMPRGCTAMRPQELQGSSSGRLEVR
jgi:hypothetical protein